MNTHRARFTRTILIVCMLFGCASPSGEQNRTPTVPSVSSQSRDTHERLHGVLWSQTAAEYWALSSSTYHRAQLELESAIADKSWSAALEQTAGYEHLPPAIILDLDETVLDNSPFQGQLVLDRSGYSPDTWNGWVDKSTADSIPGSVEFIHFAEGKGIKVFYITNRTAKEQEKTLLNLAELGITASDSTLLCTDETGWTSDKTMRRTEVAKNHRILLLIGDDLNDFVSATGLTPEQRNALARAHSDRWGESWILLPNPLYGSWERSLYPGLSDDEKILIKKREQVRGYRP